MGERSSLDPVQSLVLAAFSVATLGVLWVGAVMFEFYRRDAHWIAPYAYTTVILGVVAPIVAWAAPWPFHTPLRRLIVGALPVLWVLGLLGNTVVVATVSRTP